MSARRILAPLSLAVAACAGASPPAEPAAPPPAIAPPSPAPLPAVVATAAPAPAPAPGCAALSGYLDLGDGRRALVRSPALRGPSPTVIALHGYTGSPEAIERTSGWSDFLAGKEALLVYPEGTTTKPVGFGWNTGSARFSTSGVDDVAYLRALVDRLVAERCADPKRVLITGESNGGAMTLLAACDARTAGAFALAAPVIPAIDEGVLRRCGSGPVSMGPQAAPNPGPLQGPPLRLVAIAGKRDRVVTYDGTYAAGLSPLLGQEAWFLRVAAARNGCAADRPERAAIDDATVLTPRACSSTLRLVAVDDGVHTWPGGPVGTGGLPPGRFPATRYLWRESGFDK